MIKELSSVELTTSQRSWQEKDGVIYFSVTSDGTTGEDWIIRLETKGFSVDDDAKEVLRSSDFKPTSGAMTEIVVLKGESFEDDDRITDRITSTIRAEANERGYRMPNAEVACLIREKFTDKEIEAMGLIWIVVMHEPVYNFYSNSDWLSSYDGHLLKVNCHAGKRSLDVCNCDPFLGWEREFGFAFVKS